MRLKTRKLISEVINNENAIVATSASTADKEILTDRDFMSKYIWITNKDAERQLLTINDIQAIIETKIEDLQSKGIPPRIIVLKARQEGVSTYVQGKMISNTVQKKDRVGLIVAHKEDSVRSIFKKAKFMFDNLDDSIKPARKASNAKELIFDKTSYTNGEEGLNSSIKVSIAGNEDIGRGDTIQYCHLSEFAFWKGSDDNSPESQLSAITQAVPKSIDTFVIIESTAKGFNCFKDTWDKAVAGENGFTPLFFAWHDMAEYRIEFKTKEEKQQFVVTMDDYEKEIQQRFDLELEQMNWYRTTKKTNCNNNYDKMKQENPSFPEEAFIFTGTPVFDNEIVMQRINVLEKEYKNKQLKTGRFRFEWDNVETKGKILDDTIEFKPGKKNANIIIYEEPKRGYYYAIGGDTKGEGKDFYTATVINNINKKQVAIIKMQINNSKPFTWQLYCLARYYNDALVGVEINFNTAPIEELERLTYFRMYQRETYDSISGEYQKKYGWKTDGTTRPLIIDKQVHMINEHVDNIRHIETLREMLTFIEDKNGRPDAMSGKHDDLLFSDMIAREISKQQVCTVDTEITIDNRKNMFYNDINGRDNEYY